MGPENRHHEPTSQNPYTGIQIAVVRSRSLMRQASQDDIQEAATETLIPSAMQVSRELYTEIPYDLPDPVVGVLRSVQRPTLLHNRSFWAFLHRGIL